VHRRTFFVLLLASTPVAAHHGVAPHYDDSKTVTIDGVVAKFDFINPHAFVYVDRVTADGNKETWQCELASRSVLARNGLTQDTFAPGARVTIEGAAARKNPTGCALRVARFADGSVLRSTTLFGPTQTDASAMPEGPASIVGTWTTKRFDVSMYEGVLTPAGEAARAAFDPIKDDPAIYCDPASPVRFWVNVNEPFEIKRETDRVVIDHQFMDSRRVVYLDGRPPAADAPRSSMGHSLGRFEGDALVITTDHFTAATLEPRRGVMHTADLKLTERLAVDRESGELVISWTIDDPAYFKEPLTQTERYVRSRRDGGRYDCKPGYQQ
jgi:Family of unknown function (DUF6152)